MCADPASDISPQSQFFLKGPNSTQKLSIRRNPPKRRSSAAAQQRNSAATTLRIAAAASTLSHLALQWLPHLTPSPPSASRPTLARPLSQLSFPSLRPFPIIIFPFYIYSPIASNTHPHTQHNPKGIPHTLPPLRRLTTQLLYPDTQKAPLQEAHRPLLLILTFALLHPIKNLIPAPSLACHHL